MEQTLVEPGGTGVPCCAPLMSAAVPAEHAGELARAFKALADPVRLRLLSMIASAGAEVCVCDLSAAFALTGPTISHHLRVLREAGLVDCERRGTWVYYWPRPAAIRRLSVLLSAPEG
ncbi:MULTISPECIES: ArsR/SmtB family transcription factor [unclassified Solwaraspora]|uniref:ArsR/SmtB family transcription factor n=1 Tax=unclassified Solwaraspora TaxID=2627926 RepID=UPI00259BA494|nr:metalloregulator ArsR/SmtB family transcription factor [Solwaraspora sp. WMMA2056]WJK39185.1 metalloregulator ArsR/SmtB family transcription factor [Solwaraspora sp. WMMA2056]